MCYVRLIACFLPNIHHARSWCHVALVMSCFDVTSHFPWAPMRATEPNNCDLASLQKSSQNVPQIGPKILPKMLPNRSIPEAPGFKQWGFSQEWFFIDSGDQFWNWKCSPNRSQNQNIFRCPPGTRFMRWELPKRSKITSKIDSKINIFLRRCKTWKSCSRLDGSLVFEV